MKIASGKVIKAIRLHLSYTQKFVANHLNITITTLANIENGRVSLDIEKLYHLSLLYRMPARDILELIIEIHEKGNEEGLVSAIRQLRYITEYDLKFVEELHTTL
ncbi:helix-turn-helix transcriptional regulator [Pedobacter sp. SL55]|uniref:helix-turn-helix transcriptional regulator n=1 Tax=Pedobacter sp. SL55 TaxID=2995161 RepID=UPI0022702B02|nr:helix-turn-helix transcriptional regulator [Pedobacter sp. SL55]WAC42014.1 helix-turn-helix transcriptional regulator [Pedobacter sp. SL55]